MVTGIAGGLVAVAAGITYLAWASTRRLRREQFIRQYVLPKGLFDKLRERRPQLTQKDCSLVARGLRKFFLAHLNCGRKFVSMPSQVADELWHEFILYTREYQSFCQHAFGRFLHHSPAVAIGSQEQVNAGLRRTWWYACKEENISPRDPVRLPLLFALDAKLNIENGFRYVPNCGPLRPAGEAGSGVIYCGTDFSRGGCGGGSFELGTSGGDGCGGGGCGGD